MADKPWDDEDWQQNDELTSGAWNQHVAEHRSVYDPSTDEVVADVNNQVVDTDDLQNESAIANLRSEAITQFNRIRSRAGVPSGAIVGARPAATVGLSNSGALSAASRIDIGSDSDASTAADSGSGTESDPYVIQDRDLDNSEASGSRGGFYWDDTSADYVIKLQNCHIRGYDTEQISHHASGKLILKNCLIHSGSTSTRGITTLDTGNLELRQTNIAGCGADGISKFGTGDILLVDTVFDDDQEAWSGNGNGIQSNEPGEITLRYVEITAVDRAGIRHGEAVTYDARNLHVHDTGHSGIDDAGDPAADMEGSYFKYCRFENGVANNLVTTRGRRDVRFEYCDFIDAPDGERAFFATVDDDSNPSDDIVCYRCYGRDTNGTGGAGNEVFESWNSMNVRFEECFVEDASEDAYEHAYPVSGCEVINCAGLGVTGDLVDFFKSSDGSGTQTTKRDVGGLVDGIYGECGGNALIVTDVDGVDSHDIFVDCGDALVYNGSDTAGPENCRHYGSLPNTAVVSGDYIRDDQGTNEIVYYGTGGVTDENDTAPDTSTEVR